MKIMIKANCWYSDCPLRSTSHFTECRFTIIWVSCMPFPANALSCFQILQTHQMHIRSFSSHLIPSIYGLRTTSCCHSRPITNVLACSLWITWLLRIAAHDFDFLGLHVVLVVKLEVDVFDEESPDVIAETIGIQMALHSTPSITHSLKPTVALP